jgi:protein required for attachment to host cells
LRRRRNIVGCGTFAKEQPSSTLTLQSGAANQKKERIMANVVLKHGLWVMVADGEKALFLKNGGDTKYPDFQLVREMQQDNPPTREQGTDRPGRYNGGPSAQRSAVADTDWHRVGKERFADEIAERLYKMAHNGDFKEIVLVAPPMVLGEMRKKLHRTVSEKVMAEIPKTLTNHAVPDIEAILNTA